MAFCLLPSLCFLSFVVSGIEGGGCANMSSICNNTIRCELDLTPVEGSYGSFGPLSRCIIMVIVVMGFVFLNVLVVSSKVSQLNGK